MLYRAIRKCEIVGANEELVLYANKLAAAKCLANAFSSPGPEDFASSSFSAFGLHATPDSFAQAGVTPTRNPNPGPEATQARRSPRDRHTPHADRRTPHAGAALAT